MHKGLADAVRLELLMRNAAAAAPRHSHASALIAAGTDPVTVSRRLGHASVTRMMSIYAHAFDRNDETAAEAMTQC